MNVTSSLDRAFLPTSTWLAALSRIDSVPKSGGTSAKEAPRRLLCLFKLAATLLDSGVFSHSVCKGLGVRDDEAPLNSEC